MAELSNGDVPGSVKRLGDLADPSSFHGPIELPQDPAWLPGSLEKMLVIRVVEELIGDKVASGEIQCPCHLAIGQEAPAVGVAKWIRAGDRIFGAHRSHAHFLALGGSIKGLLAEVLGKDTGVSRGMGGSMHLADHELGLIGTVPIVGATIPIAVGAALAASLDGNGDIAVSFFGDGATEEGAFHESMNIARTHNLPVLFVCENNLFSSHLHILLRQPGDSVVRYADAHDVSWDRVDGNDIVAVSDKAESAIASMRAGNGPHFLELVTYRWRGHVGPREDEDVGVKRKEDLTEWKKRDPVSRLSAAMIAAGLTSAEEISSLTRDIRARVQAAWDEAVTDPFPAEDALLARVYS